MHGFVNLLPPGSGVIDIPIYSWAISTNQRRTNYRTSGSSGYPVRRAGIIEEILVIRGVDYPVQYNVGIEAQVKNTYQLGWIDWNLGHRKIVEFDSILNRYEIFINYSKAIPIFEWSATFNGVDNQKLFTGIAIPPGTDNNILCRSNFCERTITTTDPSLNSGFVKHVRQLNLVAELESKKYVTSASNNRQVDSFGVPDVTASMVVEGDFDYWLSHISMFDDAYDYKIYWGTGLSDYYSLPSMKVLAVRDINVNVRTGEMISATVELGVGI